MLARRREPPVQKHKGKEKLWNCREGTAAHRGREPETEVGLACSSKYRGENTAEGRKAGEISVGVMVTDILGPNYI